MENTVVQKGYVGIVLGLYWGYMGKMENDMETVILGPLNPKPPKP